MDATYSDQGSSPEGNADRAIRATASATTVTPIGLPTASDSGAAAATPPVEAAEQNPMPETPASRKARAALP